jgi:glycosyltransferase involved in cell wall biosynthesis
MTTPPRPLVLHARVVSGTGGGPEKTILNSPRFLRALGYESSCLYLHPPEDPGVQVLQAKALAADAEFLGMEDRGPFDLSLVKKLVALCRERQVAIWHAHEYKTNLLGLLVRRSIPELKLITTLHGWVLKTWKTPLYYTLDKFTLRHYDAVIAVSEDLFTQAQQWRVKPERLTLIHNAIDTHDFRRTMTRVEARAALGMSTDAMVLGGLGRLSFEKGFDVLIKAVDDLLRQGRRVELWIGGEGAERAALEELTQQLGVAAPTVRLLGHLPDPRVFLQGLDVFVLSSRREGLPNVLLEAMALEVPVVSTRVAGVPSLITDQQHGLLVDIEDREAMVVAIGRILDSNDFRQQIVDNARARIEGEFDFRQRMRRVAHVYSQM